MSVELVKQQLQALSPPARRMFTVLYRCPDWMTRKQLAQAIEHKSLFSYDRDLLAEMIRCGLVEEDAQNLEIMVRYRYRVPKVVRTAVQSLISEHKSTLEQTQAGPR